MRFFMEWGEGEVGEDWLLMKPFDGKNTGNDELMKE